MARVFLSRSDENYPTLKQHLAAGRHELIAKSLIQIEFLDFDMPSMVDWVFFASKNAVESYFAQENYGTHLYAALGSGTAKTLEKFGLAHFVGDEKDIKKTAFDFNEKLKECRVLFPSSNISVRSVQNELPANQVIDVLTYRNTLRSHELPDCDIYVFSSPSNVNSFAKKNTFPENCTVLVPGEKTKHAVENYCKANIIDVRSLADSAVTGTIFPDILS